jgi:hypothetical protein
MLAPKSNLLRIAASALSAMTATAIFATGAWAHDAPSGWNYPLSCCSGYDCREVSANAIEEGPNGYIIKATGEVIPMQDYKVRFSPDGQFHWCSKQGRDDTPTICLFVPPRAF